MGTQPLVKDTPWTEEDLEGLDEAYKYEIVDGQLLVSPRPANRHISVSSVLTERLLRVLPRGHEPWVEPMLTLPNSSRSPDLVVVDLAAVDLSAMSIRPADVLLAVEIESPSSVGEDRIRKPAEYAAAGIPAYWHVSQDTSPLITAYLLEAGSTVYRQVSGPAPSVALPYAVDLG